MNQNQNYQLCTKWCVWLKYLGAENQQDYKQSLKNICTIETYNDLIYYWEVSPFKDVRKFLVFEGDNNKNSYPSFKINDKEKFISAISYFRAGIDPSWEDPKNKFGGRLLFQIDKQIEKYQEIYQWLVFYFLGQSESCAQDINGIRFIAHKHTCFISYHYRVQVWTKFNLQDDEKVKDFRDTFVKDFFNAFLSKGTNLKNFKPFFQNNQQKNKNKQEGNAQKQDKEKPKN